MYDITASFDKDNFCFYCKMLKKFIGYAHKVENGHQKSREKEKRLWRPVFMIVKRVRLKPRFG